MKNKTTENLKVLLAVAESLQELDIEVIGVEFNDLIIKGENFKHRVKVTTTEFYPELSNDFLDLKEFKKLVRTRERVETTKKTASRSLDDIMQETINLRYALQDLSIDRYASLEKLEKIEQALSELPF